MLTQEEIDRIRALREAREDAQAQCSQAPDLHGRHLVEATTRHLDAALYPLIPSLLSAAEVGLKLSDAVREWDKATVEYDRACLNCEGRLAFDLADARRDAAVTALHTLAKSLPPTTSTRSE